MEKNGCINLVKDAIVRNRPVPPDIVPGTALRHFLYKSRANVQFTMSSYAPGFTSVSQRRGLVALFNTLLLEPLIEILIDPLA